MNKSAQLTPTQLYTLPSIQLYSQSQLIDYCRCILYTIIFHRSLGAIRPIDVQCDSFDELVYSKHYTEYHEPNDIEPKLEQSIQSFHSRINKLYMDTINTTRYQSMPVQYTGSNNIHGTITLGFFNKSNNPSTSNTTNSSNHTTTSKSYQPTGWLSSIVSSVVNVTSAVTSNLSPHQSDTRQFWERWTIPIVYQPIQPIQYNYINQLQNDIRNIMLYITDICNTNKDHLPLVSNKASNVPLFYPFEYVHNQYIILYIM